MRLKILHVANTQFFIDTLLSDKLFGLWSAGCDIHTAAAPGLSGGVPLYPFFPIDLPRDIVPPRDAKAAAQLIKLCKTHRYDLIHTHSAKAGFIGRMVASQLHIPCVHTVHGLPFFEGQRRPIYRFYRLLEKHASHWSGAILSQNRADLEIMREAKFHAPLLYEGNGVDVDKLQKQYDRCGARAQLGLRETDVAIAFFARFEPVKGHLFFLSAFEKLLQTQPNAVALLGGANLGRGGRYCGQVARAIESSPAKDRIRLLGFCQDVPRLLSGCDMLTLPSQKEGIPRVAMEAMALGLPIVATDVPGTRELVQHEHTGLLSAYGDADALAHNLDTLCRHLHLRVRYGLNGCSHVREHFNESQVIGRILSAYNLVYHQSSYNLH